MKVIIAGSRSIPSQRFIKYAVSVSNYPMTGVISGCADGADEFGELWAESQNIPIRRFKPDWHKYGKSAGFIRNSQMAKYGNALIAIWDGKSSGTKHIIDLMKKQKKPVFILHVDIFPSFSLSESSILYAEGQIIANGFTRIVTGDRGSYVEFSEDQVVREHFTIHPRYRWRVSSNKAAYSAFFVKNTKIYLQKQTVDYADYKKDMFYVSPFDLTHDEKEDNYILKIEDSVKKIEKFNNKIQKVIF